MVLLIVLVFFKRLSDMYIFSDRRTIEYRVWYSSKDSLRKLIEDAVMKEKDIQYYNPYRGIGQANTLRVIYKDSLAFDLEWYIITPLSGSGINMFSFFAKREDKDNYFSFAKKIISKVRTLESKGIYSIIRRDSVVKVNTSYYDSSYNELQRQHSFYHDEFYESESFDGAKGRKFCLSFSFYNSKPGKDLLRHLNDICYRWELDSTCYYHRTYLPIYK